MTLAPHLPLPFLSRGGAVRRPPDATHLHLGKAFSLPAEPRVKGLVNFLLQMICNNQTPIPAGQGPPLRHGNCRLGRWDTPCFLGVQIARGKPCLDPYKTFALKQGWLVAGPLLAAGVAVAADFGAGDGDLDAAVALDLVLELLEQAALELAHLATAQASDVDVVAGAVAFVVVLVAADVQQVELVDQPVALEQIESPIDGDAVHPRVDALRPAEDGAGIEVPLGAIHHLQQDAPLASQPHTAVFERRLQLARPGIGVDSFARGNAAGS